MGPSEASGAAAAVAVMRHGGFPPGRLLPRSGAAV